MHQFDTDEWVYVDLYTRGGSRPGYLRKAWCMFKHPESGQWMSAFGKFDPKVRPSKDGVVARLTARRIKDKNPNADWYKGRQKERQGYEIVPSQRGIYINARTREIIDLDFAPESIIQAIKGRSRPHDSATKSTYPEMAPIRSKVADSFAQIDTADAPAWF